MTVTPQSPQKLHLVSEVLLKQWSQPAPGNEKQIRRFDVNFRKMRFSSPSRTCYTDELYTLDSQAFEDTWKPVEDKAEPVLSEINSGRQLNNSSIPILMEFLAIHLIRSFSYWERHRRRLLEMIGTLDLGNIPVEALVAMYRKRHHELYPPYRNDRTRTEEAWRSNLEDLFNHGPYSADAMMEISKVAHAHLSSHIPKIVHVGDPSSAFVISDCPVLPLAGPDGLVQEPFGPTVGAYFFPLGRKYALFTGNHFQELTSDEVENLNRLQIVNAKKWVVWSPDDDERGTRITNVNDLWDV